MPASVDILPTETSQAPRSARKQQLPVDKDGTGAFPQAVRQVEADSKSAAKTAPVGTKDGTAKSGTPSSPAAAASDGETPTSAPNTATRPEDTLSRLTAKSSPLDNISETMESDTLLEGSVPDLPGASVPARETLTATAALSLAASGLTADQQTAPTSAPAALNVVPVSPAVVVPSGNNPAATTAQPGAPVAPAPAAALQGEPASRPQSVPQPATNGNIAATTGSITKPDGPAPQADPTAQQRPLAAAPQSAPASAQSQVAAAATPVAGSLVAPAIGAQSRQPAAATPTAAQPVSGATRTTVLPASSIEEVPVPELARIDVAARKTAAATLSSAGTKPQSAVSGGGQTTGLTSPAAAALSASAQGAEKNADLSTPIMLAQRGNTQPATIQPMLEAQSVVPQSTAEAPLPSNLTPVSSGQAVSQAQATQSLSFAQQMAQSAAQPPAQQLGISIARGAKEGLDRIEIQLHPAELGRVDVRMELGHDGRIMAVVSAERSDTLEQLRRDIDQLERALADAGFDMDANSFRFEEGRGETAGKGEGGSDTDADQDPDIAALQASAARTLHFDGIRVDISV